MAEALGYVRRRLDLVLILVVVAILGAFGMNFPVTNALMATTEFRMGPGEFGLLGSVMAAGTLGGALLAARRSGPRLRFLLGGALGLGFFTLMASISPSFWLYAAILVPVGLASIMFLNSCNTSIQLSVDRQFRGGVLALYLAVLQGGTALGAPLMGWIGTEFGARWAVAAGGTIVLLPSAGFTAHHSCRRRVPFWTQPGGQLTDPAARSFVAFDFVRPADRFRVDDHSSSRASLACSFGACSLFVRKFEQDSMRSHSQGPSPGSRRQ